MEETMSETIWSMSLGDERKVYVKEMYRSSNEVPSGYEVTYRTMIGDGAKRQKQFPASCKHEAIAYAKGFCRAQKLDW
jgi:hypothetical protein